MSFGQQQAIHLYSARLRFVRHSRSGVFPRRSSTPAPCLTKAQPHLIPLLSWLRDLGNAQKCYKKSEV